MIHARIDTVDHRKLLGFETGTRAQFDIRYGLNPLWVFLDYFDVKQRVDFKNFLLRPFDYKLDENNNLLLTDEPPIVVVEEVPIVPSGYQALRGRDNRYLKGQDGNFIYGRLDGYVSPPAGEVYIMDDVNIFIVDPDGSFLTEPE